MNHDQNRPHHAWQFDTSFTDKASGITVRVNRSDGFRPRYSMEIGRLNADTGAFQRFFPLWSEVISGRVSLREFDVDALEELIIQAENHVTVQLQKREDEILKVRPGPDKIGRIDKAAEPKAAK